MKHLFIVLFAIIFMSSFVFAQSNTSTITTEGDGNTATATQIGSTNNAVIDQTANTSTATQYQLGSNNKATITQYGQWPAGPVVNQVAIQTQTGSGHEAQIRQITDSGNGNSTSEQLQDGAGHYAKAWQFSWNSEITQTQYDENNWAEAYQKGFNNTIEQIQDGKGNVAAVDEQTGWGSVYGNFAGQYQTGRWNHSLIGQNGGDGNNATVTQIGDDNWAGFGLSGGGQWGIYQSGSGNIADVNQNLNVNKSEVFQYGNGNTVNLTQNGGTGLFNTYGDYVNKSIVTQNGNENTGTVTQTYTP